MATSCSRPRAAVVLVGDPKLGPLEDNGGPTETRALGAGSAARDLASAGTACSAPTDQRGLPRPQGSACDSGAYEAAAPSATTGGAGPTTDTATTLAGTVSTNMHPTTYYFEFGTTDSYGSRTEAKNAAGELTPASASATLRGLKPSTTYHYRIVAFNEEGTAAGDDASFTTAATPVDTIKPIFLAASLTSRIWAVDNSGSAETAVAASVKRGTTFKYRLSEAGRVVFTIDKATSGRKVGTSCKKPTRSNRKRKKCTLYKRAGRFAQDSVAGANTKRFSGRIGSRSLSPGKYRANLVAIDAAGNRSATKRLSFRVVRAGR